MTILRPYRFITTIEASTAKELDDQLAKIAVPFSIIAIYCSEGTHYAKINPVRPLVRNIVKKSPRDTNKTYKES